MERKTSNKFFLGYVTGMGVMMAGQLIGSAIDEEPLDPIQAQTSNAQIEDELTASFSPVHDLIIDGKTFTFKTTNEDSAETCSGDYQVQKEVARISGEITCSRTIATEDSN